MATKDKARSRNRAPILAKNLHHNTLKAGDNPRRAALVLTASATISSFVWQRKQASKNVVSRHAVSASSLPGHHAVARSYAED